MASSPNAIYTYSNSYLVNCGSPLLPPNVFIIVSNDTIEGSSNCSLAPHPETVYTTVCNQAGNWEPPPADICQMGMQ